MRDRYFITLCGALAVLAVLAAAQTALAQDAAESATILSGTGQGTGAAARDMGGAVRDSISGAADAIAATRSARSNASGSGSSSRGSSSRSSGASTGYWITSDVDALEGFAVPTYRLNNGAILKVSGILMATPDAACLRNCIKK